MSDAKGSGERQRPGRPGQASGAESAQAGLPASAWLAEMIAERRMSQVRPNMARSGDLITQASTHIGSARKIASTDSTLALAACHDAIRKALDAHAGAMGYRFENSPGAHRTAIEYGRQVLAGRLDSNDLDDANRLRNRRHSAEYGEVPAAQIGADEIEYFAALALRIVDVVTAELAGTARPAVRPRRPSSAD